MALVLGTNCGFVTTAPTTDPQETGALFDDKSLAVKDVAPVGAIKITEIGFYSAAVSEEANVEVGIYDHDPTLDEPENRLGVASFAKGTTVGWKSAAVDVNITAGVTYWLAAQCDDTATTSKLDMKTSGGLRLVYKTGQTSLLNPWGISFSKVDDYLYAIYAVVEVEAPVGTNMKVNIGDVFKDVDSIKINIGDAWKDVAEVKQNIGDAWKAVF